MRGAMKDFEPQAAVLIDDVLRKMTEEDNARGIEDGIHSLERTSAQSLDHLAKKNFLTGTASNFVRDAVASTWPWDDWRWDLIADRLDLQEREAKRWFGAFSDSARNLTERLARLKYQEFAERVERIHNQWVEAVNKTLDELVGLRGDLASARYQRTPPEKRQICETPEEVDKVFAEMMD